MFILRILDACLCFAEVSLGREGRLCVALRCVGVRLVVLSLRTIDSSLVKRLLVVAPEDLGACLGLPCVLACHLRCLLQQLGLVCG